MTYRPSLSPGVASLIGEQPGPPTITCDSCGATFAIKHKHGVFPLWFTAGKSPRNWRVERDGDTRRDWCPKCKPEGEPPGYDPNTLTAERRLELQLIATRAERRKTGEPFTPSHAMLRWLQAHGYVTRTKVPPGGGRSAWLASIVLTSKGWEAAEEAQERNQMEATR